MTEHEIQNQIRLETAPYAILFRVNVGSGFTKDGRYFNTGVPKGFSDLSEFANRTARLSLSRLKHLKADLPTSR